MHILNPNMYEEGCQVSNYIYQTCNSKWPTLGILLLLHYYDKYCLYTIFIIFISMKFDIFWNKKKLNFMNHTSGRLMNLLM